MKNICIITGTRAEYGLLKGLIKDLNDDIRVSKLEKCVILYQMGTFVGNDILDDISQYANFSCNRSEARKFLEENSSFISY